MLSTIVNSRKPFNNDNNVNEKVNIMPYYNSEHNNKLLSTLCAFQVKRGKNFN